MRKIVALVPAMIVMIAASGCCCGWPHGWGGGGGGGYNSYYGGYGGGGCPGGNCGIDGGPAVIPQSTYYNNNPAIIQAGAQTPVPGPITFAPAPYHTGFYPTTALVDPWPTY